jgi:hypothetical protein
VGNDEGLTDWSGLRLLRAAKEALKPGARTFVEIVDAIREDHVRTAKMLITDAKVFAELSKDVEKECAWLASLLGAAQVHSHLEITYARSRIDFGSDHR